MTSVEPVETRSTIASASPRRGATSTAPEIGMMSTAMPALREEPPGAVRVRRRDAQPGEILDRLVGRVGGYGGGEAAPAVPELADARQLGAGLGQEVDARDAQVRHAVADELDDVVRADEEDVEVEVLDARDEAPVVLLEDETGVMEETPGSARRAVPCSGRPAGDGPSSLGRGGVGRGTVARGGVELVEHRAVAAFAVVQPGAMRVIVAVLAPVSREISA